MVRWLEKRSFVCEWSAVADIQTHHLVVEVPVWDSTLKRSPGPGAEAEAPLEQAFLLRTIDSCRSKAAAAKLLDITPQALNYKLHRNPKDSTADRTEGFK